MRRLTRSELMDMWTLIIGMLAVGLTLIWASGVGG